MATKKRRCASQGRDTPKLSPKYAKAVTEGFEGAIAQIEKRCPRKDTRVNCANALIVKLKSYVHDLKDPEQAAVARLEQLTQADQKRKAKLVKKRRVAQLEADQLAERGKPAFLAVGRFFGAMMSLAAMLLVYKLVGLKGAKSRKSWNKRQRARTNFDAFTMRGYTVNLLEDAARCAPAPYTGREATPHIWSRAYQAV
jgi:hypothetical protein